MRGCETELAVNVVKPRRMEQAISLGPQLRSGKMAGIRLQNAVVGARHAARERSKASTTPDCLMARMMPSLP